MHPRIAELIEYIDDQTARLRAAYHSVPREQRAVRPAPDRWSPAEVVHHVVIVERRIALRLATLIEQARTLPPESDSTPTFPNAVTNRVENRDQRFRTSEAGEPHNTDPGRVWDDLAEARQDLKQVIATGDGLQLGAVSAPHPALGPFTAYDWIAFAGAHAARHADQIREMAASTKAASV
jgi:DinB family protein